MYKSLKQLDLELTKSCNLQCFSCNHYSNFGLVDTIPDNTRAEWLVNFFEYIQSADITLNTLNFVGGEPFLNKNISLFLEIAAKYKQLKILSNIIVITNGTILNDSILDALVKWKNFISIRVSIHSLTEVKLNKKVYQNIETMRDAGLSLVVKDSASKWHHRVKTIQGKIYPFAEGDPDTSYDICLSKKCRTLHNNAIYYCPPVANLNEALSKLGQLDDRDWEPYINDTEISFDYLNHTHEEFLEYWNSKAHDFCTMCPKSEVIISNPPVFRKNYTV